MRRLLLLFFLTVSLCVNAKSIYVLSVGISDYKYINDLHMAEKDAGSIAELYRTHTSHVKTLLGSQATHDNILTTLRTFFSQAGADDIVVFFFSGHGDKGGLCAYDTRSSSSMVTYAEIRNAISGCRARNKQLFIDACFSGGLRDSSAQSANNANSSPLSSNTEGVMLFLSSRSGEASRENIWADKGLFTQYLIKGMKGGADTNGDRIITAKEIFKYVSSGVSQRTNKKQNPVMWGKFNDDMHIMNWNPAR